MNTKVRNMLITLTLALALFAGLVVVGKNQAQQAEAASTDGYASYTWTWTAVTAGSAGTARFTADYGVGECYQITDVTLVNGASVRYDHSPDATAGHIATGSTGAVASATADSVEFTSTIPSYGLYLHPTLVLTGSNPITVTLKCVFKDTKS